MLKTFYFAIIFDNPSYLFFYLTLTFIGSVYGNYLLIKPEGSLRRGFKIWSEKLPDKYRLLLLSINNDVFDDYYNFNKSTHFIRIHNQEYLIRATRKGEFTSWPIIAYVDLNKSVPKIEYRSSRMAYAFLVPFILLIIPIPFIVLIIIWNYRRESRNIKNYLDDKLY